MSLADVFSCPKSDYDMSDTLNNTYIQTSCISRSERSHICRTAWFLAKHRQGDPGLDAPLLDHTYLQRHQQYYLRLCLQSCNCIPLNSAHHYGYQWNRVFSLTQLQRQRSTIFLLLLGSWVSLSSTRKIQRVQSSLVSVRLRASSVGSALEIQ